MEIINLSDKKDWQEFIKNFQSDSETLIYKYSPICGVSYSTDQIIDEWIMLNKNNQHLRVIKIDVVLSRSLSRKIADDLNVKHESPQVIWLDREMRVKFHSSHYDIKKEELDKYL
jgi:bacillithiol system protein YtxJ